MANFDWDRVRALFDELVELPVAQRAAFLDRTCPGDDDARRELESLLDHESRADDAFLRPPESGPAIAPNPVRPLDPAIAPDPATPLDPASAPPDPSLPSPDPARLVGEMIGPYRLLRLLGKGGMSVVYLAEQERPRRFVALKIMHGGLLSRSAWRRFEYESEILARLRHPNIAQVYEAGTYTPQRTPPPLPSGEGRG